MPLIRPILAAAAVLAAIVPASAGAAFRSYLASDGVDTNPCSLQQPCRLLPAAMAAVDNGGEVWILDSANYNTGPVAINKSVSILAVPGAVGSVVANLGQGLSISGAGVKVILRNLVFVNLAAGTNGVAMTGGSSLTVIDCKFNGLQGAALFVNAPGAQVQVLRSSFVGNAVGVRVFNGIVDLVDNDIMNAIIAIEAAGSGGANVNPPNGTTRVRVSGGNLLNNANVYHMDSSGLRQSGQCNGSNIWVRANPLGPQVVGYTTLISLTNLPASDWNSGCVSDVPFYTIDSYNSPWK